MKFHDIPKYNDSINEFFLQFYVFYLSNDRNRHFTSDHFTIYLRKSYRLNKTKQLAKFIDIGSINIEPEDQNKGLFTAILNGFLTQYREHIFIENVHNDVVYFVAKKFGFEKTEDVFSYHLYLYRT